MAIFQDGDDFKVITGNVILAYDGTKKADPKGKYSVKVLVPKGDMTTISEIEQLISSKAIPAGLNLPPYFSPGHQYHDGDYSKHEPYRGHWVFNAGTQFQPGIVDANGAPFDPAFQKLYSGCIIQIVIHAFAYTGKEGSLPGVSLGLDAIKVLDNTQPVMPGGGGGADAATLFNQGVAVVRAAIAAVLPTAVAPVAPVAAPLAPVAVVPAAVVPAAVVPAAVVPAGVVPAGVVPAAVVPAAVVPAAVVPAAVVPAAVVPAAVVPAAVVPAAVVPAAVVPAAVVPAGVVPAAVVPAGVVPAAVVPAGVGVIAYDVNGKPVSPAYDFNTGGQP